MKAIAQALPPLLSETQTVYFANVMQVMFYVARLLCPNVLAENQSPQSALKTYAAVAESAAETGA